MRVSKDSFEVVTREFTMKSGGKEAIRVKLEPLVMAEHVEDYALEFDGKGSYVVADLGNPIHAKSPLTIECWLTRLSPTPVREFSVVVLYGGFCDIKDLPFSKIGSSFKNEEERVLQIKSVNPSKTVHAALVYDGGNCRQYINGCLSEELAFWEGSQKLEDISKEPVWPNPKISHGDLYVGSNSPKPKHADTYPFHGIIDEVRISDIARYTEDFSPQKRFKPDEHTMALYHFDEGKGDLLHDSSGNGHHGKIVGAKWIKADGSPITRRTAEPTPSSKQPTGKEPPPLSIAPFGAAQAKKHQQAWADYLGVPVERDIDLGGGVKLTMVLIPPGEFMMGSTEEEQKRFLEEAKADDDEWGIERIPTEGPQHRVRITKPFYLGRYEVTRGQFRQFVKETQFRTDAEQDRQGGRRLVDGKWVQDPRFIWSADPGFAQTDDHPVVNVSWNDAMAFCQWLSNKQDGVKLPSEAQWEYACRAGTSTYWHCGDDRALLRQCAWLVDNSGGKAHPVGQLKWNPWGLYDMHGNAFEWCADRFEPDYYSQSPTDDPIGPSTDSYRVYRGGCWFNPARFCRSAYRNRFVRSYRITNLGFRVAAVLSGK